MGLPIVIENVSHDYETRDRRVPALKNISLQAEAGEFITILGPSGCGKSTLLLVTAGLVKPSSGSVRIGGKLITEPYTSLGVVFQDSTLLEWRTALKNILIQAEVRHMDKRAAQKRALELMRQTNLEGFEYSYPSQLSGGMRQRVAICRALLHSPPLLLMDEPFGALDALTREQMRMELQSWLRDGVTVLFVTHDIREAIFLGDRVVVMSPGPGQILDTFTVAASRPREFEMIQAPQAAALETQIRKLLTDRGFLRTDFQGTGVPSE